jgi:DNA-binding MarR family transcriptional regulator
MSLASLTEKEKLVFYNIVKSPEMTDIEISKATEIKRSTVTAIRNRLKSERLYHTFVIPNLAALGCKVIGVMYGKYKNTRAERSTAKTFKEKTLHPELVFSNSTDGETIGIYFAKDLADIRKTMDTFIIDYEAHDFLEKVDTVYYPIEMCKIKSFFNYTPLLSKLFKIKEASEFPEPWVENKVNLTNAEKSIFYNIVKYPEANTIEVSKKTGKTRSTVSRVKKKLEKEGLIKTINIPALGKLGCELMVFFHAKFSPKAIMSERQDGINLTLKEATPMFKISGDIESVGILIPRNYTEYTEIYNNIISYYKEKGYINKKPEIILFSIDKIKLWKLEFAPLVEKLLFGKYE